MKTSKAVFRVGISGSYGGLNLGDEAILQSIIAELRRALPVEITVFSRNPEDTLARHHVERAVPVRKLSRDEVLPEIERLDLETITKWGLRGLLHRFLSGLHARIPLTKQVPEVTV